MLKKLMTFAFIASLIFTFTFTSVDAAGNFEPEKFPYKEMQVQVMPEFDYPENWPEGEPALLVGYFGTIVNKSGSDFNGEFSFSLPMDQKNFQVYLAAEFPEEGKPEVQVDYKINKDKNTITWKPTKTIKKDASYKYVIEYYANPIEVKDNKSFQYKFNPPADMEQLDVVFYAPINSKDFTMEPKATDETKSEYGEEIHHFQYLNAKQGTEISYNASYVKKDNKSSMSVINTQQPPKDQNHEGVTGNTATEQLQGGGQTSESKKRPIIDTTGAVIIGFSLIIMGVFIFLGLKGKTVAPKPTSNKKQSLSKSTPKGPKHSKAVSKEDEKKQLRKMLMDGEIDKQTYDEKIKNLG